MKNRIKFIFSGGLGNQLFQFAAFIYLLKIKRENVEPILDCYLTDSYHYGVELQKIFHTDFEEYIDRVESYRKARHIPFIDEFKRLSKITLRKLAGYATIYNNDASTIELLNSQLKSHSKIVLAGFFQNPTFAEASEMVLRNTLINYSSLGEANDLILKSVENRNTVSIHIRRGDYLKIPDYQVFNGLNYYYDAINYIADRINNPVFLIFSDDSQWVKENLHIRHDSIFVNCNNGDESFKDLLMMARCHHNIIANSSFSWWGAWLNPTPNKIVIAPDKWFKGTDSNKVIPTDWIMIQS